jgi:hypothetical protein
MKRDCKSWFWRSAAQVFLGGVGWVLVTFLCFQLELNLPTTGFAYWVLVVLLSVMDSFIGSLILSTVAVGLPNYSFIQPP